MWKSTEKWIEKAGIYDIKIKDRRGDKWESESRVLRQFLKFSSFVIGDSLHQTWAFVVEVEYDSNRDS